MKAEHLIKGQTAEALAERYVRRHGLTIVSRNFSCRFGEIDLICRDADELVFLEVRYRSASRFGSAAETVTIRKQQKLIKTAQSFLAAHPKLQRMTMRFDVIGIDSEQSIEWIKGAFLS